MKIVLKVFGYILMICYFLLAISISILVLKENEYGLTKFGNKYLVVIDIDSENDNYKSGDLVIVKSKQLNDFKEGEEIFLYTSKINNKVDIKICTVKEVSIGTDPEYITTKEDIGYYRKDSILGISTKKIKTIGGIIDFLKDKIIFLVLLIVPAVILLVFELLV